MTAVDSLLILSAAVCAGGINAVVGSGTLVTFPLLLAIGFSPVTANMSNNVGLVPGSVAAAVGYRAQLRGQRARAVRMGAASAVGAAVGSVLLLVLPAGAFRAIVPAFIAIALVLNVGQRRLVAAAARRHVADRPGSSSPVTGGVLLTGIYGGYFGAAQGILLLALLGVTLPQGIQRTNALKNVLAAVNNGTAAITFVALGTVDWRAVSLIAAGSVIGGHVGGRLARRLPDAAFRAAVVVVGCAAIVKLLAG